MMHSRDVLGFLLVASLGACTGTGGTNGDAGASGVDSATRADAASDARVATDGGHDLVIGPTYVPAPEVAVVASVPHGTVEETTLSSSASAIYPLDIVTSQPFDRAVSVYVPAQYVAGTAAPFIVVQDGISFYRDTMVPVLDNMIAQRRLPAMIAIFVEPGPNEDTPLGERSHEYDTVSDDYVRFVETELLPMLESLYGFTLTTDPEGRAAMGGSSGGAAAFTMGWMRPDLYHRILTYSGSFCDLQPTAAHPLGAWEYHDTLIAAGPVLPLRVALEVGENDLNWNTDTDMHRDWQTANRAMASALAARGYAYRFVYALGADHIDMGVLQQTLPETLAWLWEGYPIP